MGTRTASAKTKTAQSPKSTAAETQRNSPAPDILAELATPCVPSCIQKGASPLQQFERFAKGEPNVTLADVQRLAGFLLAALEDPVCPQPSPGIEFLKRENSMAKLRDLTAVLEPSLACYYLTGNFSDPSTRASAKPPILSAELTAGIPDPSQTLLRYFQKKILDAGVLSSFENDVRDLANIVASAHVANNHMTEKRAQNEHLLAPVKTALPKLGEKLKTLLPFIPDYKSLPSRLTLRLPEAEARITSYHLPGVLKALRTLAQELNEAQEVMKRKLSENSSSKK